MNSFTPSNKHIHQPLNVYNIYFILERRRLIQEMEGPGETAAVQKHQELPRDLAGYDLLTLPDLPPRFQKLQLPHGWFVPGKNSKRKHVRSHGLTSFAELARSVAVSWRSIDRETKEYCLKVASILKERHAELTKVKGIDILSMSESIDPGPKKKTKPRSADNLTNDSEPTQFGGKWCLPTNGCDNVEILQPMPSVLNHQGAPKDSALPTMEHLSVEKLQQMPPGLIQHGGQTRSVPVMTGGDDYNEVEFPIVTNVNRRAAISNMMVGIDSFEEQQIFQVNALIHEEYGLFGEHTRSSAPELLKSIQEKQVDAIKRARRESALPTMEHLSVEMLQQMPPGLNQQRGRKRTIGQVSVEKLQQMTPGLVQHGGQTRTAPIMTVGDGYNELEFPIVKNVNQRAAISNMMVGIGSFELLPSFHMNALSHEENGFFGEHMRSSSTPELLKDIQDKQPKTIFKAQELDIPDSDIIGMWDQDSFMRQLKFSSL